MRVSIAREKTGRTVACRLTARPMEQAMNWLNRYAQFWSDNLDRLAAFVEEDPWSTNRPKIRSRSRSAAPQVRAPKPHPHAASPRAAGKSLRRVDRAGKPSAVVRARARLKPGTTQRRARRPRRRPLPRSASPGSNGEYHEVGGVYREVVPNEKLVFSWAWHSTPEREIRGDGVDQAGRRRHAAHLPSRAVRR